MYFVYVLKSSSARKSYVGHTDNIERRIQEHNSGKSTFKRKFIPWEILYTEEHLTLEEAIKREKYLKCAAGRKFLKAQYK